MSLLLVPYPKRGNGETEETLREDVLRMHTCLDVMMAYVQWAFVMHFSDLDSALHLWYILHLGFRNQLALYVS